MKKDNHYINFYSGSEISIIVLRKQLEEIGIFGIVQNDFNSGNLAGFVGGTSSTVRLKIKELDIEKAQSVLEAFLNSKDIFSSKE